MSNAPHIRMATEADAEAIRAIYAPFVTDTPITFEEEIPSIDEMRKRVRETLERLPWLVYEAGGAVRGYAYASVHNARASYRWAVNVSVYLADGWRGKGIGRALYTALFALLTRQGYYVAIGGITVPNPASFGLHESMGFTLVGVYHNVGWKHGKWHDAAWLEKALRAADEDAAPEETVSWRDVWEMPEWQATLAKLQPVG